MPLAVFWLEGDSKAGEIAYLIHLAVDIACWAMPLRPIDWLASPWFCPATRSAFNPPLAEETCTAPASLPNCWFPPQLFPSVLKVWPGPVVNVHVYIVLAAVEITGGTHTLGNSLYLVQSLATN